MSVCIIIEGKMYYNYYETTQYEYDECIANGICSIDPSLSSLQEVILLYLKELAFYLLELKDLGVSNEKIKDNVLDTISGLISNIDYGQEQFQLVINRLYGDLLQAKELYTSLCEKHNLEANVLKSTLKISRNFSLSDAIKQGERTFLKKNKLFTVEQKNLFEVILLVIKSVCINLAELKGLDVEDKEAYHELLSMLNTMNHYTISAAKLREKIEKFVMLDYSLLQLLYDKRIEKYGEITPTEVSFSTRPNKAILVSGTDISELDLVLKATANRGIDVYTHGAMIMGHSFPKIKAHPHLVGHFGKGTENCLLDFTVFPGAIFMTRHSLQKIEHLYRGRLYTTDLIIPKGVMFIKGNDFEPLIESALSAKGFTKGQQRSPAKIGFCEKEVVAKLSDVADKIATGEVKHFFVIGISNNSHSQRQYFENFLSFVPKDCFVLSFSYTNGSGNILHIDADYGYPLFYKALNVISQKIKLSDLKLSLLLTRCDQHSISNLLNVKYMGIKDIYLTNCSPNLFNPSLVDALRIMFNINSYGDPYTDLKAMLAKYD